MNKSLYFIILLMLSGCQHIPWIKSPLPIAKPTPLSAPTTTPSATPSTSTTEADIPSTPTADFFLLENWF